MRKQLATYEVLALMGRDAMRATQAPPAPPPPPPYPDLSGDLIQVQTVLTEVRGEKDRLARELEEMRRELGRVRDEVRA